MTFIKLRAEWCPLLVQYSAGSICRQQSNEHYPWTSSIYCNVYFHNMDFDYSIIVLNMSITKEYKNENRNKNHKKKFTKKSGGGE